MKDLFLAAKHNLWGVGGYMSEEVTHSKLIISRLTDRT